MYIDRYKYRFLKCNLVLHFCSVIFILCYPEVNTIKKSLQNGIYGDGAKVFSPAFLNILMSE